MRLRSLVFLFFVLSGAALAQDKNFTVQSSANDVIANGVSVSFTYALPKDDPFAASTDEAARPTKVIWYWGDDERGAKSKNYLETAYLTPVSHLYKKPGQYGVLLVIVDRKNRLVRETGISIKISAPVAIFVPDSTH